MKKMNFSSSSNEVKNTENDVCAPMYSAKYEEMFYDDVESDFTDKCHLIDDTYNTRFKKNNGNIPTKTDSSVIEFFRNVKDYIHKMVNSDEFKDKLKRDEDNLFASLCNDFKQKHTLVKDLSEDKNIYNQQSCKINIIREKVKPYFISNIISDKYFNDNPINLKPECIYNIRDRNLCDKEYSLNQVLKLFDIEDKLDIINEEGLTYSYSNLDNAEVCLLLNSVRECIKLSDNIYIVEEPEWSGFKTIYKDGDDEIIIGETKGLSDILGITYDLFYNEEYEYYIRRVLFSASLINHFLSNPYLTNYLIVNYTYLNDLVFVHYGTNILNIIFDRFSIVDGLGIGISSKNHFIYKFTNKDFPAYLSADYIEINNYCSSEFKDERYSGYYINYIESVNTFIKYTTISLGYALLNNYLLNF